MAENIFLGIDVGGTKIESFLVDFSTKHQNGYLIASQKRVATERSLGYGHIVDQIVLSVEATLKASNKKMAQISGIGIAMPGTIHPVTKKMLKGNTEVLVDKDISADLAYQLNYNGPFTLENDANCFALSEYKFGVGRECEPNATSCVGVILGTGMGGGFVISGQVFSGAMGAATEIGHTVLHENGRHCYCGKKGCAEQYLAGSSVEKLYFESTDLKLDSRSIFEAAERGDEIAVRIVNNYICDLGKNLALVNNIINPNFFVLGGGVSRQTVLYEKVMNEMKKHVFVKDFVPKVYRNRLGDSCGGLGAAYLASSMGV